MWKNSHGDFNEHRSTYLIMLIAINVIFGLIMYRSPTIATVHALAVLFAGILFLLRKNLSYFLYTLSYGAAAHILWRMTDAKVFWEYSKYLSILLLSLGMFRFKARRTLPLVLLLYLFFLSVSVPLTLKFYGIPACRKPLAFNLSGPVLLVISMVFFKDLELTRSQICGIYLSIILPIISVASISTYTILTTKHLHFSATTSNPLASGGFGPNQVSAILGAGAFIGFLIVANYYTKKTNIFLMLGVVLWFLLQAILTFSRGGVFNFFAALTTYTLLTQRFSSEIRRKFILLIGTFALLSGLLILKLNEFTGGKLKERYTDLSTTGRIDIAKSELKLFIEHPILGVGPGVGIIERARYLGEYVASHTEYTRLLAEHGIFGLMALFIIFSVFYEIYKKASNDRKGEVAGILIWSILEMSHSATRFALTTYLPGLCLVELEDEKSANFRTFKR